MSNTTNRLSTGFLNPKGLLLAGIILLIAGLCINYYFGMKGVLRLEAGRANTLMTANKTDDDADQSQRQPGITLTLDSLSIQPHTPEFEIQVWKRDSMPANPHAQYAPAVKTLVGAFPLEQMKIRQIDKTDLRFRLKEFYPNFEFAYEYPANRDSIAPRAPGITLELKTSVGLPIVTLGYQKPSKQTLGDIVSLGASLIFYWELPEDTLKAIVGNEKNPGDKIVFAGADNKVFFILNGTIEEQPLKEKSFYAMPGQDSVGFTIIYCFPDAALLKAVPSSKGTDLLNPVAHVEVWKEGEGYRDAFVYPEAGSRKSGDFEIPGSDYKLGMAVVSEKELKHCTCSISFQKDSTQAPQSVAFASGRSRNYQGYRFRPLECNAGIPQTVKMEVVKYPGKLPVMLGSLLLGIGLLLSFLRRNSLFFREKHPPVQ